MEGKEVTSQDYINVNIKKWQALADRADLIGKQVVFDNRMGGTTEKGKIRSIKVEEGRFIIESDPIEAGYNAPTLRFKIDEERDPDQIGDTIFCDLDDDCRQIRISTTEPVLTSA